ncbi:MAG: hypothetical protein ACREVE_09505 [Gammaproteobacteria bacterium]
MLTWRAIRKVAESKAFWSLNFLLIVVPFLARIRFPIGFDLFALYIAAILLAGATLLYLTWKPPLIEFDSVGDFTKTGRTLDYVREVYEAEVGPVAEVENKGIKTELENRHRTEKINGGTFWFVLDQLDVARARARFCITGLYAAVATILFFVNAYRFMTVVEAIIK